MYTAERPFLPSAEIRFIAPPEHLEPLGDAADGRLAIGTTADRQFPAGKDDYPAFSDVSGEVPAMAYPFAGTTEVSFTSPHETPVPVNPDISPKGLEFRSAVE